jgi:UDP-3-O-[3-hydroxymyristoyl] N-acetylglucosamine deacetylase/3-hydroxyacyl-[acyl-carrier-protein] dehydratase
MGDLSLVGRPLCGHVVAVRPSHGANCELAKLIQAQMKKPLAAARTFSPPPPPPPPSETKPVVPTEAETLSSMMVDGATLDIVQVKKILPHRYPFLMVDKVTRIEGQKITGVKNVSGNEAYFEGHFPNHPVMPGVLQLEAMAQVAGILMLRQAENFGKIAYFMSAEKVKWRKPVRPGDVLVIDVELTKSKGKIGKAKGVCYVNDDTVSEADITFMLVQDK